LSVSSDYQQVLELAHLFGRANDERTELAFDFIDRCLIEDVDMDYGLTGRWKGRELHKRVLKAAQTVFTFSHHIITGPIIQIDGDRAHGEHMICAPHGVLADGVLHTVWAGGVYLQDCVRTSHGWRVRRHKFKPTWADSNSGLLARVAEVVQAVIAEPV